MKKSLMLIASMILAGCGMGNDASENGKDLVKVKNSAIEQVDREESEDISNHLIELAERVPEVNDATALAIGNFAVVGIDVKANLERSEVGTVKYAVAESMKDDPYGANALVIADPDLTARLKEVARDFDDGKPLQGIMNELADITGRLMPEVPNAIIDPDPENAPEEPKDKLDSRKNEQKLNQKQDKQSNYQKEN